MGQDYLDSIVAFSLGAVANAREDPNGYRGSWTVEVYALCAY